MEKKLMMHAKSLLREIKLSDSFKDRMELLEKIERNKEMQESTVKKNLLDSYEKSLKQSLLPKGDFENSENYKKLMKAYDNWFISLEFNEYFTDAWGKIFAYQNKDWETLSEEGSWWSLEQIYYTVLKILEEMKTRKLTESEDAFLGNFLTCFPNYNDISVVHLASHFFACFANFYYSLTTCETDSLTALEKIKLASIWKEHLNSAKELQLTKERMI